MSKKNWSTYNQKLVNKGNLYLYISSEVDQIWYANKEGKKHRPKKYSDILITYFLYIKFAFNLPYRQLEGFIKSCFKDIIKKYDLDVPSYTQIQERAAKLDLTEIRKSIAKNKKNNALPMNST